MKTTSAIAISAMVILSNAAYAGDGFKLPKSVTPQMRAACESDVRRLCIGRKPTVAKVKRCVRRNFSKLGMRCQVTLAAAGFGR
jgi:hypothetical protein